MGRIEIKKKERERLIQEFCTTFDVGIGVSTKATHSIKNIIEKNQNSP